MDFAVVSQLIVEIIQTLLKLGELSTKLFVEVLPLPVPGWALNLVGIGIDLGLFWLAFRVVKSKLLWGVLIILLVSSALSINVFGFLDQIIKLLQYKAF